MLSARQKQTNKTQTRSKAIKQQTQTIKAASPEQDLLNRTQAVLKAATHNLKYTQAIRNIERIPDIKAISLKYDLPAIGILDGGQKNEKGASVTLKTETVIIAVYVKVLGDQETCIDEIRQIIIKCVTELRKKEHYIGGGSFVGYTRAWCEKQGEIKQIYKAEDYSPLLLKLARIEFTKQEINT